MEPWTITSLGKAYREGKASIVEVAQKYVDRIMELDPSTTNAVITLNPFWKEQASGLQANLFSDSPPLHGIPILIKDNIDTLDMGNSAGSVALKDVPVDFDAPIVAQLQAAGALILGKTNLSEWANFRSTDSVSGWSSLGGQTRNALDTQYNPSGSSSGSAAAVAAHLAVAAIGTETDGSIVSPSSHNGIVGLKPTIGRVSRTGIIPIALSQDTAGPMTNSVLDAAELLNHLSAPDSADNATLHQPKSVESFAVHCTEGFLKNKRIGLFEPDARFPTETKLAFEHMTELLMRGGAQCIVLDPVPAMATLQDHEIMQMICEFPEALADYFKTRRQHSPYKTLAELKAFNDEHAETVLSRFGQEWFEKCLTAPGTLSSQYKDAQEAIEQFRNEMAQHWFEAHNLDTIVTATNGPSWKINPKQTDRYTGGNSYIGAVSGWPSLTVPYAKINPNRSLGALFVAQPWNEATLLGIGHGFEHQVKSSLPITIEPVE